MIILFYSHNHSIANTSSILLILLLTLLHSIYNNLYTMHKMLSDMITYSITNPLISCSMNLYSKIYP